MVRTLIVSFVLLAYCNALQAAAPKPAYQLLPPTTQAVVWMPDSDVLTERWGRTQLSKLSDDPQIKEFWRDQQGEIEEKLTAAGWRLHIQPRDLSDVVAGQVALAWIERKEFVQKPYALVLIVDVINKAQQTEAFLKKLDNQLKERGSQRKQLSHGGVDIAQHTVNRIAGEILPQETFYAVVNEQLLASDDLNTLQALINASQDQPNIPTLQNEAVFQEVRQQLKPSNEAQLEYFARPLGFARVLRAISGKRSSGKADILAVLQAQGFDSLKAVCGELKMGAERFDLVHRGYILAQGSLTTRPDSVQILDFPNQAARDVPAWVSDKVSSMVSVCWNVRDAFWKAEGLVDAMAGQKDIFNEIIKGIKDDRTGPQIDIRNELMPLLTNEIYTLSDAKLPIAVDSKRNLIAVRVTDGPKMSAILDRAMKQEPDAEPFTLRNGHNIWKVVHKPEEEISFDDFDNFGAQKAGNPPASEEPLLSNWAITVYGGYLLFASHEELIEDAVNLAKSKQPSPLLQQADFQRIMSAITSEIDDAPLCAWRINRSALAYRVQYELFKQGQLQASKGMYAMILENLIDSKSEMEPKQPKKAIVDGTKLPTFETISKYLQPSGGYIRTQENGWSYGAMLLSAAEQPTQVGSSNAANKPTSTATNR